jgi:hypothetical protein
MRFTPKIVHGQILINYHSERILKLHNNLKMSCEPYFDFEAETVTNKSGYGLLKSLR